MISTMNELHSAVEEIEYLRRELDHAWQQSASKWRDSTRQEFEMRYWGPMRELTRQYERSTEDLRHFFQRLRELEHDDQI